ncbi:sulfite exporter TauE/SafE family protein [Simiduia sp. 21SJ11W-1]|uniref:sulfite exporter TauE/SafE family protein n=1 Tax=Simiduia sp. 21SJ11W-1 TaxID=2909669 RepID=UPI00209F7804|nr:sulfite exporter TauE/SafE family protein [Simiduia sp. 21SJ11W-1]UTA47227.1 sulfite exporter TauE/SafE family protein [Simiduia sp. 21SJ11W-1]
MEFSLALASMFAAGLLGAGHCLGMCGGIVGALSLAGGEQRWLRLALYNIGRISSYSLLGAVVGALGYAFEQIAGPWLRIVAGSLLILMGCYLADWWRALVVLERAGAKVWRILAPLGQRLLPLQSHWQALPLGMVWGFLPCGLVYTALAFAASQGTVATGAAAMAAFGLGTMPALLVSGAFAVQLKQWLAKRALRQTLALLLIAFGVWTIFMSLQHAGHGHHHQQSEAPAEANQSERHNHQHHQNDHPSPEHSEHPHNPLPDHSKHSEHHHPAPSEPEGETRPEAQHQAHH